ncbi:glycosyltransferase family 4 protein [Sphingomonas montanisoli]|nr:glycosyltransferase family 4 protein [Sphingomonas montanisoli]
MKIAMLDPSLFTWPYDISLCLAQIRHGHDVTLLARKPFSPPDAALAQHLDPHFYKLVEGDWAEKLPHKVFLTLKGLSHIGSMIRLVARLEREKPDVIHFQWTPLPVVDRRFLNRLRRIAPIVLTVHDSAPFNENPSSRVQQLGSTSIMREFDRVIVHTAKAKARILEYGVEPSRVAQIAHGMLEEVAPPSGKPQPPRAEGDVVLLLFGRLKPYKGIDVMIRAVAALPPALRGRVRVRIVGKPHMPVEPLQALAAELGIADRVDFEFRFIDDAEVGDLLRAADIQMFPYFEIDASGVLMAVLGVGRPIIASDIGLFREMLDDGVHGRLVPPGDVAALSAAIAELVADDAGRAEAGRQVAALRDSIPSWEDIAAQTTALYEDAIAQRR